MTSVGGWLYRVAFRTALKARTSASPPTIACPYTNASTCHAVRPQSSPPQAVISPSGPPTPRNTAPPSPPAMAACRSCWRLRRPVSTYCCTADPAASPAIPAGMPNGPPSHPPTAAARAAWITEAKNDEERVRREQSDFLRYEDANEGKADFHSLWHKFIPELVKAGVQPQDAKELARHATISLTMDRYAHTTLTDTAAALSKMTGPIARPQVPPSVPIPDNGR